MSYPLVRRPTHSGEGRKGARIPATMLGVLAAGLVLVLPGQARADGYGHAEITIGLPHGAITLGRTWEDPPRQVVVEQVTHKYPEADDEAEAEADDGAFYEDEADEADVIIEKRIVRPRPRRVTIIERYEEPVHVVRYVERPSCEPNVVVLGRPRVHVVHASPTVIVAPRAAYHGGGRHGHGHGGGSYKYKNSGGSRGSHRDLFPEDSGRPMRVRGVGKQMVHVGSHR